MGGMGLKFIPMLARCSLGLLYVNLDLELMFLGLIATLKTVFNVYLRPGKTDDSFIISGFSKTHVGRRSFLILS